MSMSDYLSSLTADYTDSTLSVSPQKTMTEAADKNQIVHEADDGTVAVASLSNQTWFTVTLQWEIISTSDSNTILDFWAGANKGNGRERTFYWEHPTEKDGEGNAMIYTVRFLEPINRVYTAGLVNHRKISQTKLRVEGVKI